MVRQARIGIGKPNVGPRGWGDQGSALVIASLLNVEVVIFDETTGVVQEHNPVIFAGGAGAGGANLPTISLLRVGQTHYKALLQK